MKTLVLSISAFFLISFSSFAQEHELEEEEHEGKNRIGFVAEATFIPEGTSSEHGEETNGDSKGIVVPTIGLEYTRTLSHHWDVGLSAELELDHYIILDKELDRENALILVVFATYRLVGTWFIFGGAGMEYENHKSLGIFRFGTAYEFLMGNGWDFTPAFTFDHKIDVNSFALGFSIGKRF
jgi:hypothetical protein